MSSDIKRPDTGTQRNMIIVMAAAIVESKIEYLQCIVDQRKKKGIPAETLEKDIERMKTTVELLDENAGCWS